MDASQASPFFPNKKKRVTQITRFYFNVQQSQSMFTVSTVLIPIDSECHGLAPPSALEENFPFIFP